MNTSSVASLPILLLLASGCERTTNLVTRTDTAMDASVGDAAQPDAGSGADSALAALCKNKPCACNNGEDDDGDGLIDGLDSECTGPYDQDESSFATGEPKGGGNPFCVDCFFDFNEGAGDDGCSIAQSCGVSGDSAGAPGSCALCTTTRECRSNCEILTPNGCDCFGCCEIWSGSDVINVQLTDTCSADPDVLAKPSLCPRCIPSSDCFNACGRCELCPGRREADLPPECNQGEGVGYRCDDGDVCGDKKPCAVGRYCSQGCCVPVPV